MGAHPWAKPKMARRERLRLGLGDRWRRGQRGRDERAGCCCSKQRMERWLRAAWDSGDGAMEAGAAWIQAGNSMREEVARGGVCRPKQGRPRCRGGDDRAGLSRGTWRSSGEAPRRRLGSKMNLATGTAGTGRRGHTALVTGGHGSRGELLYLAREREN